MFIELTGTYPILKQSQKFLPTHKSKEKKEKSLAFP